MIIGKRFNPYKTFTGSWIPNWLLERTEINSSCKLVYARLCQHSGKDGECYPGIETIAAEVGLSKSMVEKCLVELRSLKLIESVQRGLNQSNEYHFLTHEWMTSGKQWKQEPHYSTVPEPHSVTVQEPHPIVDIRDAPKEMLLRKDAPRALNTVKRKRDPTLQAFDRWKDEATVQAAATRLIELVWPSEVS